MQIAFRVKTDAAILGAGCVIAGGADMYPAPPALPCHHPKLTTSFSPQTRNATCGSPRFVRHKTISERPSLFRLLHGQTHLSGLTPENQLQEEDEEYSRKGALRRCSGQTKDAKFQNQRRRRVFHAKAQRAQSFGTREDTELQLRKTRKTAEEFSRKGHSFVKKLRQAQRERAQRS
jgi:hypothetical protein